LAKVADFAISKAADRAIQWPPDRKRTAARGLLRFYETLEESSLLLEQLIEVFNEAIKRKKPILFSKDLVPFENRVTRLTEDLKSQYDKLVGAIYIFDRRLALLLERIQGFKTVSLSAFGILLAKARFEIDYDGLHSFSKVSFSTFHDEMAEIDFEAIIKSQKFVGRPVKEESFFPDATNKLVEALSVLLVEDEFTASDFEKVKYLRDRFQRQAKSLEKTLAMLREFIASNFTIADVLGYGKGRRKGVEVLTGTGQIRKSRVRLQKIAIK
jgi:hypothetical protein